MWRTIYGRAQLWGGEAWNGMCLFIDYYVVITIIIIIHHISHSSRTHRSARRTAPRNLQASLRIQKIRIQSVRLLGQGARISQSSATLPRKPTILPYRPHLTVHALRSGRLPPAPAQPGVSSPSALAAPSCDFHEIRQSCAPSPRPRRLRKTRKKLVKRR